jgi:hypothetical protein
MDPNYSYAAEVLLVYSLIAAIGIVCDLAVIVSILQRPMKTPNVRYVLLLTVALFLEQIVSFPQIYVKYYSVCSTMSFLETYFAMMILCAGNCMVILAYFQLFM